MCACSNSNLSKKKEQKTLEELKQREDIVLTKADKGRSVVILDVKYYITESNNKIIKPHQTLQTFRALSSNRKKCYSQQSSKATN